MAVAQKMLLQCASYSDLQVFSVSESDTPYYLNSHEQASIAGMSPGDPLAEIHVNLDVNPDPYKMTSLFERGIIAARYLLEDWITLAGLTSQGEYTRSKGFTGCSPIIQPHALRQLGATVQPEVMHHTTLRDLQEEYKDMTGETAPNRRVFRFIISHAALIESVPVAQQKLERLGRLEVKSTAIV